MVVSGYVHRGGQPGEGNCQIQSELTTSTEQDKFGRGSEAGVRCLISLFDVGQRKLFLCNEYKFVR